MADCYGYGSALPDSQVAANILVSETDRPFVTVHGGMYLQAMNDLACADPVLGMDDDGDIGNDPFDFALTSTSPARDAGMTLPAGYPTLDAVDKIDIGAVEYGCSTDEYGIAYDHDWPRPRRTVYDTTVPDGFSPLPDPTSVREPPFASRSDDWDATRLHAGQPAQAHRNASTGITVFDTRGRTVRPGQRPPNGVHLLRVTNGKQTMVRRLTIVR